MDPFMKSASETAGLKFAPETDPSAKIATINEDAMERTAQVELPVSTLAPTVPTRMKVPRNSEMQFFTSVLTIVKCVKGAFNFDQLTASLRLARANVNFANNDISVLKTRTPDMIEVIF